MHRLRHRQPVTALTVVIAPHHHPFDPRTVHALTRTVILSTAPKAPNWSARAYRAPVSISTLIVGSEVSQLRPEG